MANRKPEALPSLEVVLAKINESVDDFSAKPAKTASDQGAFEDYPMHKVAIWGDVVSAEVLLNNGADPNVSGEDGDTPLHRAVVGRHTKMVEFLIAHGADPYRRNQYGKTPEDDALQSGEEGLIRAVRSRLQK